MKIESLMYEFADYLLTVYADRVLEELSKDSRYAKHWASRSTEFISHMRSLGYPTEINFTLDQIKGFFVIKKYKDYILIEISRRSRVGRGSLERYLRTIEYGTSRVPARYLFTPICKDIRLNLRHYWDDFYETNVESTTSTRKESHYERYMKERSRRR